ncbi:MAG: hypothetical protein R2681_04410 [Pyrinomonadaceae bacterium]
MKKLFASLLESRRLYKEFKKTNKIYKVFRYSATGIFGIYALILIFPQILFAHQTNHQNLHVHSRLRPNENAIIEILKSADEKLSRSPIYDKSSPQNIFLTESHPFYKFFTLSAYSFGSTMPYVGNVRINKTDIEKDLVIRNTEKPDRRSLSGVIAHEVTHNQISKKYGLVKYMRIPRWKDEGYAEYIAGETTLSFEEGVKLWKANDNSPHLVYFKYHQIVKFLLETENVSVSDLFEKEFDVKELEQKVFKRVCQN